MIEYIDNNTAQTVVANDTAKISMDFDTEYNMMLTDTFQNDSQSKGIAITSESLIVFKPTQTNGSAASNSYISIGGS